MRFVVYSAVVVATVFSVALEWDALVQPSASTRRAMHAVSELGARPPSPRPDNAAAARRSYGANPATPAPDDRAQVVQGSAAVPAANPGPADAISPSTPNAAASAAPAPPPPQCDVNACASAYGSFRASDCTWQPYEGPRRLCTKGAAADVSPDASAANARADDNAVARCHYRTCAEHYSSFNPADCTYQPLDGPRRRCEK
jgi:hypothetical protein